MTSCKLCSPSDSLVHVMYWWFNIMILLMVPMIIWYSSYWYVNGTLRRFRYEFLHHWCSVVFYFALRYFSTSSIASPEILEVSPLAMPLFWSTAVMFTSNKAFSKMCYPKEIVNSLPYYITLFVSDCYLRLETIVNDNCESVSQWPKCSSSCNGQDVKREKMKMLCHQEDGGNTFNTITRK